MVDPVDARVPHSSKRIWIRSEGSASLRTCGLSHYYIGQPGGTNCCPSRKDGRPSRRKSTALEQEDLDQIGRKCFFKNMWIVPLLYRPTWWYELLSISQRWSTQ